MFQNVHAPPDSIPGVYIEGLTFPSILLTRYSILILSTCTNIYIYICFFSLLPNQIHHPLYDPTPGVYVNPYLFLHLVDEVLDINSEDFKLLIAAPPHSPPHPRGLYTQIFTSSFILLTRYSMLILRISSFFSWLSSSFCRHRAWFRGKKSNTFSWSCKTK